MKPMPPVKNTQPVVSINEEIMNKLRSFFSTGQIRTSAEDFASESNAIEAKPALVVVKPKLANASGIRKDEEVTVNMPKNTFVKKYPAAAPLKENLKEISLETAKEKRHEKIIEIYREEIPITSSLTTDEIKADQTTMALESKSEPLLPEAVQISIRKWEEFQGAIN